MASSGVLPVEVRDRHRAAHDRPPEAEPDRAHEDGRQEGAVKHAEEKPRHSGKLTRDGTLRTAPGGPPESRRDPAFAGGPTDVSSGNEAELETPAWFADPRFKKADLHCHSVYSTFKYFRIANTRDSYNRPEEVYRLAKERGMDFVTITDHDSIDGCLALLDRQPGPRGLLHLRGGRDLVSRHPPADPRQRLRHRREAARRDLSGGAATSTTCTSTSARRTSSPRPTTCSRTTGCATPRGATSRRCSGCSTSSRSRTAR